MGIWDDPRIRYLPCNWVFDAGKENVIKARIDANGREMALIKQRGAICYNPDVGSEFPESSDKSKRQHWYVPSKACRKCQHHRKGGENRLRYPHCHWNSRM